ncbi:uncharacterized protein LOC141611112 isoform X2 [Silene latifolia]|uniref:uncharacterized protein LOC141611112 isoform X2 n=1 Tax=Silene latifolia TaxID=37657 RepID=UPI003D77BBA8
MDVSTTLAIVQTILTAIQTLAQLQSLFSISHCRSELDDLHNTVQTVRAVLEDADARKDSLNAQEKHYIQELKDAISDADDVLDEFLTLAKQNQLRRNKANGSARIKIGGIDIIASVKAELGRPSSSRPDHGKVSIHVDCSASVQLLHRCIRVKEMKNYRQTGTCSTARPIGVKVLLTYLLMEVRRKNLK